MRKRIGIGFKLFLTLCFPFWGMLSIGSGIQAIFYLLAMCAALSIWPVSVYYNWLDNNAARALMLLAIVTLNIIAAINAYYILKQRAWDAGNKLYSRWYVAILITALLVGILKMSLPTYKISAYTKLDPPFDPRYHVFAPKSADTPQKGDYVIFSLASSGNGIYRVAGVAGDTISKLDYDYFTSAVSVNHNRIIASTITDKQRKPIFKEKVSSFLIPKDFLLVASLNKGAKHLMLIPVSDVVGTVTYIYYDSKDSKFVFFPISPFVLRK